MSITPPKNSFPLVVEEITISSENNELTPEIKQEVPKNFLELWRPVKNNWGSTQGLSKPLGERFIFSQEEQSIILDIPYSIMQQLELVAGENCPYPIYVAPQLLKKHSISGGINVERAEEIFLLKNNEVDSEKNQKIVTINEEDLIQLRTNLITANNDLKTWTKTFPNRKASQVKKEIDENIYKKWYSEINNKYDELNKKMNPDWRKFIKFAEKEQENKSLYVHLVPANLQTFEISYYAETLPVLDVKKPWKNVFGLNYIFGSPTSFKRVFKTLEYDEFGMIYDKWRKNFYIPNPF